jgi:hypothetical protein
MAAKLGITTTKFDAKEKIEYAKRYFYERGTFTVGISFQRKTLILVSLGKEVTFTKTKEEKGFNSRVFTTQTDSLIINHSRSLNPPPPPLLLPIVGRNPPFRNESRELQK